MAQSFEEKPSPFQELTFNGMESFLRKNLGNGRHQLPGLHDSEGRFTNLAYILSDQSPWCIEFGYGTCIHRMNGPLITQIDDVMNIITAHNPPVEIKKKRGGMYRRFPSIAVKEAIVNAVIHSDLQEGADIVVEMHDGFLSVSSIGGTYVPIEWRNIEYTSPRNWILANLLVRLRYASLKGRGMALIKSCYLGSGLVPCVIIGRETFEIRLPAMDNPMVGPSTGTTLIEDYLNRKPGALLSDISHDLMVSIHYAKKIIDSMESEGKVVSLGIGSKRRTYLTKHSATDREDKSRVLR